MNEELDGRREVSSRNTKWANKIAKSLAQHSVTPNQISILSIVFSTIGGAALFLPFFFSSFSLYWAFSIYIVCIQLRLLCNLFDGMVAIEGGKKSENGDLYNDIPDRVSDVVLIIPIGYLSGGIGVELAWLAAVLAVMTAYLRWLGAFKSGNHFFNGPMAKQHRMALLTLASVITLFTIYSNHYQVVLLISLILLNVGLMATLINRLYKISRPNTKNKNI